VLSATGAFAGATVDTVAGLVDGAVRSVAQPFVGEPLERGPFFGNQDAFDRGNAVGDVGTTLVELGTGAAGLMSAAAAAGAGLGGPGLAAAGGGVLALPVATPVVVVAGVGVGTLGIYMACSNLLDPKGPFGGSNPPKAPRTVPDVLKDGGKSIGAAGRNRGVRTVGSESELQSLFDELTTGGTTVPSGTYPGKVVKTPDGSVIRMRSGSKSGGPTIDITGSNGEPLKVHIDPWPPQ